MTRNILIFLATFVVGALLALTVRSARFDAHADSASNGAAPTQHAPMVSNSNAADAQMPKTSAPSHSHEQKTDAPTSAASAGKPVNTVCAICGMDVDPALPTLEYKGQTIGFGCKLCAPKFKADPERYAPAYLKNEVIKP